MSIISSRNLPTVPGFDLKGKIADGGLSEVFLAQRGREFVALKMLAPRLVHDKTARKHMMHEAALGLSLESHPNVIRTLGRGRAGNRPYLVLEYFESNCLRDMLRKRKSFPLIETIDIARQVAAGLGHIHGAGIVHRDIKPENILVETHGRCKIIDLGIGTTRLATLFPWTRTASGSPSYMSPEQILKRRVDGRSDIYSFGCMLYELFAGNPPYGANSQGTLIQMHLDARTVPKPLDGQVPRELDGLIRSCLQRKPGDRPQDASSILYVLNKALKMARSRSR